MKLRMRFYDDAQDSPVFFEIKEARDGRTIKRRFAADRGSASMLFGSDVAELEAQIPDPGFRSALLQYNARPVIHIAYDREAYVGRDGSNTRLTMDRNVRFEAPPGALSAAMQRPVHIWKGKVILSR